MMGLFLFEKIKTFVVVGVFGFVCLFGWFFFWGGGVSKSTDTWEYFHVAYVAQKSPLSLSLSLSPSDSEQR